MWLSDHSPVKDNGREEGWVKNSKRAVIWGKSRENARWGDIVRESDAQKRSGGKEINHK